MKVPTDLIIKKAMADKGVKNGRHLFQLGGGRFTYQSVCNALNGKNIDLKNLVSMLDAMGFKLTYVEK
ncbi:MAG: hypothetical protein Unbinned6284contig1001_1 [Prokaryotic dsDNA virus sp.]|nr:MAG: hypothetical protein Unbinned6284contig1001_1 [Prokaryotic dsDNA virus sp.]